MEDYSDNDDLYNFDITPAKSLQKPRKSKREKLEEKEERRRILSKTKEERLEELLGQIHSQGAAELELERQQQREREAEEARLREEEKRRKAAMMRAEETRTKQLLARFSFSSDSLNTASTESVSVSSPVAEAVNEELEKKAEAMHSGEEVIDNLEIEQEGNQEGKALKRYSFADMSELLQQQSSPAEEGIRLSPINASSPTGSDRATQDVVNETYENDFVSDVQADMTDTTQHDTPSPAPLKPTPEKVAEKLVEEENKESPVSVGLRQHGNEDEVHAINEQVKHDAPSPVAPQPNPIQESPVEDTRSALSDTKMTEPVEEAEHESAATNAQYDTSTSLKEEPGSAHASRLDNGDANETDLARNSADKTGPTTQMEGSKALSPHESTDSSAKKKEELEAKRLFWDGMKQSASPAPSPQGMTPPPPPPESKPSFAYLQTPPPPPPKSIKLKSASKRGRKHNDTGLELTVQELQHREDGLLHQIYSLQKDKELLQKEVQEFKTKLEQSNAEVYALKTKLTEVQGMSKARLALESLDANGKEGTLSSPRLAALKKEIEEQERLLQGYQKENEKLVQELRVKDQESLMMKETLYKENKRLGRELNNTPAKPQGNAQSLRRKLEVEQQLERVQEELEASHVKQQELKSELDKARREKREVENRTGGMPSNSSARLIDELRKELAEARYEHLVEAKKLKEKLENQTIISENDALIAEQKELIEKLRCESHPSKRRSKSLLSDIKRIRALEQQVKDLEEALQKRNPDSLSNLIRAAGPSAEERKTRKLLEGKVKSLEEELKERLEASARRTRAMRQEHEKVKLHYEQMLSAKVEAGQLDKHPSNANRQLTRARIVALEEELERVRNFYRLKLEGLSKKQSQTANGPRASEAQSQREIDRLRAKATALEVKVEELENELSLVHQRDSRKESVSKGVSSLKTRDTPGLAYKLQSSKSPIDDERLNQLEAKLEEREERVKQLTRQLEESPSKQASKENGLRHNTDATSLQAFLEQKIRESDRYRTMYESLQKELESLRMAKDHMEMELKELRQAKIHENPGMLQHQSLVHRIEEMELRHTNRQRELEVVIEQLKQKADLDMQLVKSKHENELLKKDSQIKEFQTELNGIIDELQHMPR